MSTRDTTKVHFVEAENVYITPRGRSTFVALDKAFLKKNHKAGEVAKFSATIIVPPKHSGVNVSLMAMDKAACAIAAENGYPVQTFLKGDVKLVDAKKKGKFITINSPFSKADEKIAEVTSHGEPVDLAGYIMLRSSSNRRVEVRAANGALIEQDDIKAEARSGRWMRIMTRPYWYDNSGNMGVSFGLEGAQLLSNDDPIGGYGAPSGTVFGSADDAEEDDTPLQTSGEAAGDDDDDPFN